MEREPGNIVAKADRSIRAQNVDAMSANGQLLSQLGGDDSTASDRGITDDPDVHGSRFIKLDRTIGSRTKKPSARVTPASAPNCASRLSMSCMKSGVFRRVAATPAPAAGAVHCVQ